MSLAFGVAETVLPVFLVLAIGRLCRSRNIISPSGIATLKAVAVDIALPAVLLNAFATAEYDSGTVFIPLLMFAVCAVGWGIGKLISKLMGEKTSFLPYICSGFEAGMLGYMFFTMLYGKEALSSFALIDLGQVLFVFTLYKGLLGLEFSEKSSIRSLLRSMLLSPVIIAIAIGMLLGITGLYESMHRAGIGQVFDACVSFISAPTSVLILISIGYELVFHDVRWKRVLTAVFSRLAVMAVLILPLRLIISSLCPDDPMLLKALVLMLILPPPYVLPVFARDETQSAYISSVLSVSTLLSVIGFAVLAWI